MYYTYILRCSDGSLYTGITTDLERRLAEHRAKGKKCAKYTLTHTAISIEAAWESESRSLALKLEYHIKSLTKAQKEKLIINRNLEEFLSTEIDCNKYKL